MQWAVVNTWFASAGQLAGGANNVSGLYIADQGTYADMQFTGCRFFSNKGNGVMMGKNGSIQFTGCSFQSNGTGAAGDQYGFKYNPSSPVGPGPLLSGCMFNGNTPKAVQTTANARDVVINGCTFDNGIDYIEGTLLSCRSVDKVTEVYASATRPIISPCHDFVRITGTTNIAGLAATYKGHILTLKFDASLTVLDASQNLSLAGNFGAVAGSTLTMRCDGATWWEVARSNT